jgi:hypothetical protein
MLKGALLADPEAVGEAAGGGVAAGGAVTAATTMADGSCGTSGVGTVALSVSEGFAEAASAESPPVFPDFACFEDLPAAGCEFSAAVVSAFRGASDGGAAVSVMASRGGSRSWRDVRAGACEESRRSHVTGRNGSALASTSAAKPFGCDGASGAESRDGSDRAGAVALDSDVTLNTGTSAHETGTSPARNRPIHCKRKIIIDQLHIKSMKSFAEVMSRWFLPSGKICRRWPRRHDCLPGMPTLCR